MSKHLGLQRLGDKVSDNAPRHSGADVQQPARSIILPRSAVVKLPSLIQCECKNLKKIRICTVITRFTQNEGHVNTFDLIK